MPLKQLVIIYFLVYLLANAPIMAADMARGLAAAKSGNFDIAAQEWMPLAEQGDPSAQYNIAQLYRLGRGVPKNFTKASQWYEKAALQWHSAARHNLAVLYEKGHGVPLNYAKAFEWYEKAAMQNYGIAQFNLAVMYSIGQGTKRNLTKAYIWYTIAADQDVDGAEDNVSQIAQQMTAEQLKIAKKKAQDWINWRKKE